MSSDIEDDPLTSLYESISTSNYVSKAKEAELKNICETFRSLYKSENIDGISNASIQSAHPPKH